MTLYRFTSYIELEDRHEVGLLLHDLERVFCGDLEHDEKHECDHDWAIIVGEIEVPSDQDWKQLVAEGFTLSSGGPAPEEVTDDEGDG